MSKSTYDVIIWLIAWMGGGFQMMAIDAHEWRWSVAIILAAPLLSCLIPKPAES